MKRDKMAYAVLHEKGNKKNDVEINGRGTF